MFASPGRSLDLAALQRSLKQQSTKKASTGRRRSSGRKRRSSSKKVTNDVTKQQRAITITL